MLKVIEKEDWHIRSGKILKLEAWMTPAGQLVWYDMSKVDTWSTDRIRVPSEDKEILI